MSGPYVSSRSGRFAWMMQRVTAALLVPMAFIHFAMQHFTPDAVSTGLATTFRLHDPMWVAFYMVFVVCVLYHGVNGTIGIIRDYAPKPLPRGIVVAILWTLAVFFGALGIRNVLAPAHNLESAKNWYVENGFPEGESAGNPPNFLWAPRYDFQEELRELNLLNHYLERHTTRTENDPLESAIIFNGAEYGEDTAAGGRAFDEWAQGILDQGFDAHRELRRGNNIFSSTYEFALWALNVRRTNAQARVGHEDPAVSADAEAIIERLAQVPDFDHTLH
ncbi:MAG: hypothetical protein EA401_02335 [Planctomycetota bacterium]|nr:MAG: hypothetical protein EA401_02335 [Planctomycetota bacterium]